MQSALAETSGTAKLNQWGDGAGASLLPHVSGKPHLAKEVVVERMDDIAERLSLLPDLIKLDLQGGEINALRGAEACVRHTEMVIVEFGCLDAYIGRTTPLQLFDFLCSRGFRLYDIAELLYRPYDGALGSGDLFFVHERSALRKYTGWA